MGLLHWILNFDNTNYKKSVMRFCAPRTYVSFNKDSSVQSSLTIETNKYIKVTGVGVSMLPGSSVTVEIEMGEFVQKTEVVNNTNIDCVPVMFKDEAKGKRSHIIKVSVTGSGAGISCSLDPELKESYYYKKTVDCHNVCGNCTKTVTFSIMENKGSRLIQEIYFNGI